MAAHKIGKKGFRSRQRAAQKKRTGGNGKKIQKQVGKIVAIIGYRELQLNGAE